MGTSGMVLYIHFYALLIFPLCNGQSIFFISILGGAFTIVQDTGAMAGGIHALVRRFGKQQNLILLLFIFIFSVFGGTIGMAEEVIVFVPLVVMLCKQFKLDRMVALAVCMISARVGFTTGRMNPFTVGVAQGIAGLPMYSGIVFRLIWYVLILIVTCVYILRYAKKIQADPTASIMYGVSVDEDETVDEDVQMTGGHVVVLLLFLWNRIRGRYTVSVFHRTISGDHVLNAITIFVLMVTLAFAGAVFICATSPVAFEDSLFETVSAIGTVGLTAGITPHLRLPAKWMIMLFMYFGRVGLLTISFGFLKKKPSGEKYRYAATDLLIG